MTPDELKQIEQASIAGRIRGYASAFDVLEPAYNTVFDKGSFKRWIREHRGETIPIYYWHEIWGRIPIGRAIASETVYEDDVGLVYEADVLDGEEGLQLLRAVATGVVNATSHSFQARDRYQKDEVWHFKRVDLVEISPCPAQFAANPGTTCEIVEAPGLVSTNSEPARGAPLPSSAEVIYRQLKQFNEEMRR